MPFKGQAPTTTGGQNHVSLGFSNDAKKQAQDDDCWKGNFTEKTGENYNIKTVPFHFHWKERDDCIVIGTTESGCTACAILVPLWRRTAQLEGSSSDIIHTGASQVQKHAYTFWHLYFGVNELCRRQSSQGKDVSHVNEEAGFLLFPTEMQWNVYSGV